MSRADTNVRHGDARNGKWAPEYMSWHMARQRCTNPNKKQFADYGGRGIRVCDRWSSYDNFLADMGRKPGPDYSLDRIDHDGDYSPENCRWATRLEQQSNRRNSRMFTIGGERLSLAVLAKRYGLKFSTVEGRLWRGYSIEFALLPLDLFKVLAS